MEIHREKMRSFLTTLIQEITTLAEIIAAEVIREKPKEPYGHLSRCLQTMVDIRDTKDFRELMENISCINQVTHRFYQSDLKQSLELLYDKAVTAIQGPDRNGLSDCKPHTASELMQIEAATVIQQAYRRHHSASGSDTASLSQELQQTDRIIEEAYRQHCSLYELDEVSDEVEQAAIITQQAFHRLQSPVNSTDSNTSWIGNDIDPSATFLQNEEIKREDSDELIPELKKFLMDSIDETVVSNASDEENVPSWLENLGSRQRRTVPLNRQTSIIASDLRKRPTWIASNSTSKKIPSYTTHSPACKSRSSEPAFSEQCLETKYESSSNRSPYSSTRHSSCNSNEIKTLDPLTWPKDLSAEKRKSSATRQPRKSCSPANLTVSTDLKDLASCMTIKSLTVSSPPKKYSVPINSTKSPLTHSPPLSCMPASPQQSIHHATPPSSPAKSD